MKMFEEEKNNLSSRKYQRIVKKAKESRNCKEKILNSSHDASFSAFRRRKKKIDLSKSFVMRQTMALSTKNKELVTALTQSKLLSSELEKNLRLMQDRLMTVIMKLNSSEVCLAKCKKELNAARKKEELLTHLRLQLQSLLDNTAEMGESDVCMKTPQSNCNQSYQKQSAPTANRSRLISTSPKSKNNKWKPGLDKVEETGHETSLLNLTTDEVCADELTPKFQLSDSEEENDFTSPLPDLKEWLNSKSRDSTSNLDVIRLHMPKDRRKRRTTIFLSPDHDEGEADEGEAEGRLGSPHLRCSADEGGKMLPKYSADTEEKPYQPKDVAEARADDTCSSRRSIPVFLTKDIVQGKKMLPEYSAEAEEKPYQPKDVAEARADDTGSSRSGIPVFSTKDIVQEDSDPDHLPSGRKVKFCPKTNATGLPEPKPDVATSQQANETDYSIISMDLTAPTGTEIILEKQKTKRNKKRHESNKPKTKTVKKKNAKKTKDDNIVKSDMDVFNCSNDSFLINPAKKIQLSSTPEETSLREKSKSLPMCNLTNQLNEEKPQRNTRRRTCVSYAEPSLIKKLRRGDKIV